MKNIALLLVVLLAAAAAPARAEDRPAAKPAFTFGGFFKNLKLSLEQSAVAGERKKGRGAASVAAVRGKEQTTELADPNVPTLKGDSKSRKMKAQAEEDSKLLAATELVEKGQNAEALAAFRKFQAEFPKSHKEDVEKAISELEKSLAAAPAASGEETKAE